MQKKLCSSDAMIFISTEVAQYAISKKQLSTNETLVSNFFYFIKFVRNELGKGKEMTMISISIVRTIVFA